jgi:hypothetical protein
VAQAVEHFPRSTKPWIQALEPQKKKKKKNWEGNESS